MYGNVWKCYEGLALLAFLGRGAAWECLGMSGNAWECLAMLDNSEECLGVFGFAQECLGMLRNA